LLQVGKRDDRVARWILSSFYLQKFWYRNTLLSF